jgi:hypothetical protein
MFLLISKLCDIADKLDDRGRSDLADRVDRIITEITKKAYVPRFKQQIHGRGVKKVRRHLYYIRNKYKIKVRTKIYRMKKRPMLTFRKRLKHFTRL